MARLVLISDGQPFEGQMRRRGKQGYKVIQKMKDGKLVVEMEPIKFYSRRSEKRKAVAKIKFLEADLGLFGKGKTA